MLAIATAGFVLFAGSTKKFSLKLLMFIILSSLTDFVTAIVSGLTIF